MDHILASIKKVSSVTPYFFAVLDKKHQDELILKLWLNS